MVRQAQRRACHQGLAAAAAAAPQCVWSARNRRLGRGSRGSKRCPTLRTVVALSSAPATLPGESGMGAGVVTQDRRNG